MTEEELKAIAERDRLWVENPDYPTTDHGGSDRRMLLAELNRYLAKQNAFNESLEINPEGLVRIATKEALSQKRHADSV